MTTRFIYNNQVITEIAEILLMEPNSVVCIDNKYYRVSNDQCLRITHTGQYSKLVHHEIKLVPL